jgi:GNAT superfamily N-acetyltransferase
MFEIARFEGSDLEATSSLITESLDEGFRFLLRLADEWRSGRNRFDHSGEGLFLARTQQKIVGVCGLNRDPYVSQASVARLRHLYVRPANRRQGVGRLLVEHVVDFARPTFSKLRLRTDNPQAKEFYEKFGFLAVEEVSATHYLDLSR